MKGRVSERRVIRRVVLALEGRLAEARVVDAAVATAAECSAELSGVFVEDAALLAAAALPMTVEFRRGAREPRPLDVAALEQQLRTEARAAEQQLTSAARRAGVSCSFSVTRRDVAGALHALALDNDLLVLSPSAFRRQLGALAAGNGPNPEVLVVFDGTEASERALRLGVARATHEGHGMVVALPAIDRAAAQQLRQQAKAATADAGQPSLSFTDLNSLDAAGVVALLALRQPAELVLAATDAFEDPPAIGALAERLQCTALLVR